MSATVQIEGEDDNTEEVVNISGEPAKFVIDNNRITLPPGGRVRIHRAYATKTRLAPDRDPIDSVVERLTNGRVVPASDKRVPKSPTPVAKALS